jgi:septal ring factor EnvC (AmiA/AmiB activator)
MIKKILLGIGSIAVVSLGVMLVVSNSTANADDTVRMDSYNALVDRVERLESQLNEANEKIAELTNIDATVNQKLNDQSNKIATINADIKSLRTDTDSNMHKISNIIDWQIKGAEIFQEIYCNQTPILCWKRLEDFRKSQQ